MNMKYLLKIQILVADRSMQVITTGDGAGNFLKYTFSG